MSKMRIIISETWLDNSLKNIEAVLNETIEEFLQDDEEIFNIQFVEKDNGLKTFLIYVKQVNKSAEKVISEVKKVNKLENQLFLINSVLTQYCSITFTPELIEKIMQQFKHELVAGNMEWAFQ